MAIVWVGFRFLTAPEKQKLGRWMMKNTRMGGGMNCKMNQVSERGGWGEKRVKDL